SSNVFDRAPRGRTYIPRGLPGTLFLCTRSALPQRACFDRSVSARGGLRRSHPQGREARRSAGTESDQVRASDQPQDREGTRSRRAADPARVRRRGDRMKRREVITLLGGATGAWSLAARGQQPTMPVIGYLSSRSPDETAHLVAAFRRGLVENGFVEGQNVTIEYRWALGQYDRLPAMALELVRHPVTVLT